ncbi:chemotaxis protein CheW [Grimontia hollisae]|uniref:Chemotaxis protein CheW n=2 Tax=Grimontia hollisae TaxID=673 RepID=D0I4S1_GRIHO|nr:chemotaxis protein CheW [Grimontia hollisae]AMG30193.1 chemotaxis protein CheW [Grimontia hollisae]EEY73488.1 positive regulator of CheA protein activity (CheW) [Grimontia hollisae CIP 101886]MDF2183289.1 chemotaxis protein CheW [Grimontia hollisae]STO42523.1 Chemotaxis protein CheW [Grimontia hollisae]STO56441.1 Chemotaxis protein CheW [Grimontia hollisae]
MGEQALAVAESSDTLIGSEDRLKGSDFLSFDLAHELYGVDIQTVEEIRVWEQPTLIPRAPAFILGVINLRGMIVPIMDLRVRFNIGNVEYLPTTVVLILKSGAETGNRMMGIVVDAVSDVIDMGNNGLMPPIGDSVVMPFVSGLLNVDTQVMSLLNVDALLDIDSLVH